jgi:2-haloacid dehalogenase
MDRREFMVASGTLAATLSIPVAAAERKAIGSTVKAVLFDGFAIFDPRSVFKLALQFFPEKGNELVKEWRTRQFEYTWLRTLSGNYADFFKVTEEALIFASNLLGLNMSVLQQKQLMDAYYHLQTWPEVPAALARMKAAGLRLGILSNFTPEMLTVNAANNHIDGYFEHLISVDNVKKYKPDPATYALGMSIFNLPKQDILFVPFAGWDAAGAKAFGYQTYWVNGMQQPVEKLGNESDGTGKTLNDLLTYLHL